MNERYEKKKKKKTYKIIINEGGKIERKSIFE